MDERRLYQNLDDLISNEKERIAAVSVLTPTPDHSTQVARLIQAGIPVICEKAMACNLSELNLIEESLKNANHQTFLLVTYNYSGYPIVREIRNLISSGKLGKILHFNFEMPQEGFLRSKHYTDTRPDMRPQEWRLSDGIIPTISLDLAVHMNHLLGFLAPELKVTRVMADHRSYSGYEGIVDDGVMWLELDQGARGSIWQSKVALGYRNGLKLRIFGELGAVEWAQCEPEVMQWSDVNGCRWKVERGQESSELNQKRYERFKAGHPAGFIEAFANIYWDIADEIQSPTTHRPMGEPESKYLVGYGHERATLKLLEAASKSAMSGVWETVG